MAAQQMLIHLAERAHNCLRWTAQQLGPPFSDYGMLRLVRDAFHVEGYVLVQDGYIRAIGVNRHHPLAYAVRDGFQPLFSGEIEMMLWEPEEAV
mgnify:CR=1 FL=1